MQHLLFRIHGPLCSWGDVAPGTHRPTLTLPTRSAVLGLVASALGIRREEEERHAALVEELGVAVRLESAGALMSDYHTVQTPSAERKAVWTTRRDELRHASKINTILTSRDHVEDAAYTVALWSRQNASSRLASIADALDRPRFPPYLGRRACATALPFAAHVVDAATLRDAFDRASFPSADADVVARLRRATSALAGNTRRVEFDEHPRPGYGETMALPRRDDVASRARWSFCERFVHVGSHELEAAP